MIIKEMELGGRTLKLETGRIARQASGSILATYGDTMVIATAVASDSPKEGLDFFPLTVEYRERHYAAGKIPGGRCSCDKGIRRNASAMAGARGNCRAWRRCKLHG